MGGWETGHQAILETGGQVREARTASCRRRWKILICREPAGPSGRTAGGAVYQPPGGRLISRVAPRLNAGKLVNLPAFNLKEPDKKVFLWTRFFQNLFFLDGLMANWLWTNGKDKIKSKK